MGDRARLVSRLLIWIAAATAGLYAISSSFVYSKEVAVFRGEGVVIRLYDDPCRLDAVKNLPYRTTWAEGGKTYEGCYGVMGGILVVSYWESKEVSVVPARAFLPSI
jgi:hypothetical protein